MCTPNRRWLPEHSRQQNKPICAVPGGAPGGGLIREAHLGCRSSSQQRTVVSNMHEARPNDWTQLRTWAVTAHLVLRQTHQRLQALLIFCLRHRLPSLLPSPGETGPSPSSPLSIFNAFFVWGVECLIFFVWCTQRFFELVLNASCISPQTIVRSSPYIPDYAPTVPACYRSRYCQR